MQGHPADKARKYVYRIELLSLESLGGRGSFRKEYCSQFYVGDCWGYTHFLRVGYLPQFVNEGKLEFSVGIRNQDYGGLCRDMEQYIQKKDR